MLSHPPSVGPLNVCGLASFSGNAKYFLDPWPYVIIDDFLPDHLLAELIHLSLEPVPEDSFRVHHNYIGKRGDLVLSVIPRRLALSIHTASFLPLISLLQFLAPAKVHLYDYTELHIVQTGSCFRFPIHHDLRSKLLSVVIYLSPVSSCGTNVYRTNRESSFDHAIEWKVNRALAFSRMENITWHSYAGSPDGERLALVYNLMTHKPLHAVKAEGHSFLRILCGDISRYAINRLGSLKRLAD
jgi:hypothetical protein